MKKLTIGFSPCPNDTFIFDALVNRKIDTGEFLFEPILEDVETLNQWALQGKLNVSKISYGLLPLVHQQYQLLNAGSALGKGVGPLLISRKADPDFASKMNSYRVAIPGEHTTAHLLFSLAFPTVTEKKFMVFSNIENAVLKGEVDCGVIIHESRFTYQQKGLHKWLDLGDYWEKKTGVPIPLGGIVMDKKFGIADISKVDALIRRSLEYSYENYPHLSNYVKEHAQEMEEEVMRKHIDLYVNNFSLDLGDEGREAIAVLMGASRQLIG
jgi:1,4-dihydroxy-6-naphthoate synthase